MEQLDKIQAEITHLEVKQKEYEQLQEKLENAISMLLKAKDANTNVAKEIIANYISETANKKAEEIEDMSALIEQNIARIKNITIDIANKIQAIKIQIEEAKAKLNSLSTM